MKAKKLSLVAGAVSVAALGLALLPVTSASAWVDYYGNANRSSVSGHPGTSIRGTQEKKHQIFPGVGMYQSIYNTGGMIVETRMEIGGTTATDATVSGNGTGVSYTWACRSTGWGPLPQGYYS